MNTRQLNYDKDRQTRADKSPRECRASRYRFPLSRAELLELLYTCGLLPDQTGARGDRSDGGQR